MKQEKYESVLVANLFDIGFNAILNHPKSKLYAKVNCIENYSLAMFGVAYNAIMDEVLLLIDLESENFVPWWNKASAGGYRSTFNLLVQMCCEKSYEKLQETVDKKS